MVHTVVHLGDEFRLVIQMCGTGQSGNQNLVNNSKIKKDLGVRLCKYVCLLAHIR